MPLHGGTATTVVVTVDLDTLRKGVGSATVDDGTPITAAQARRLACRAGIIPAVLGGESQPLDLGRTRRLFTSTQRNALALRQPTCRAEGCTVPASWCEAHHTRPWSKGGRTDLADGMLLCPWHHHRTHDPTYTTDRLADGAVRFHRTNLRNRADPGHQHRRVSVPRATQMGGSASLGPRRWAGQGPRACGLRRRARTRPSCPAGRARSPSGGSARPRAGARDR
jgi:hypothetical protein